MPPPITRGLVSVFRRRRGALSVLARAGDDTAGKPAEIFIAHGVGAKGELFLAQKLPHAAQVLHNEAAALGAPCIGGGVLAAAAHARKINGDNAAARVQQRIDQSRAQLQVAVSHGRFRILFMRAL